MNKEILMVAETVSNEKNVEKDLIFGAVELALATATKKRYPNDDVEIKVTIDRKTGGYDTFRVWKVVADEDFTFPGRHLTLEEGKDFDESLEIGDIYYEPTESIAFGRIAAQTAKQVIVQKVREAERDKIIEAFQDSVGNLIMGTVKRTTRDGMLVEIVSEVTGGMIEAFMPKDQMLPKETFNVGERVRAVLHDINREGRGSALVLSRTDPAMLIELFKIEVPEIAEEVIQIKAVARDPGARAKIAVKTSDQRIDPIGACVGMRGARVQAVTDELGGRGAAPSMKRNDKFMMEPSESRGAPSGERIDIILYDDNPAQFVINAMSPASVSKIVVDEDTNTIDVAVEEDQKKLAIGKGGQNIRLATELCGWKLNVLTVEEAESKQAEETQTAMSVFVDSLDIDEEMAEVLVTEGFSSVEEIAYVPKDEFLTIAGLDEEIVDELKARAKDALLTKALASGGEEGAGVPAQDLLEMEGMTEELANLLARNAICTMEDLAEQGVDELLEVQGATELGVDEEKAKELIMTARAPWFE
jgi:N utilization substance protein A